MNPKSTCSLLILAVFTSNCALNPARQLVPDEREVSIEGKTFLRGDEQLDEQEFYALANDKASEEKVASSRGTAVTLQGLGLAGLIIGGLAAIAGFGATALNELEVYKYPESLGSAPMYIGIGGAIVAGLSGYLFGSQRKYANGTVRVFDVTHATHSLETSLYGEGGPQPTAVKEVFLETDSGALTFCSTSGAYVKPLTARDDKNRHMAVDLHADWFAWDTNPQGALIDVPPGEEEDGTPIPGLKFIESPMLHSLKDIDQNIKVEVQVIATGLKDTMELAPDFGCSGSSLALSGGAGKSGGDGKSGRDGSKLQSGQTGTQGNNGIDGHNGANIDVEAAWVETPNRGKLLLVVASAGSSEPKIAIFDPTKGGVFSVRATGGRGGRGGTGGRGGHGGQGDRESCARAANGGDGGPGGTGGRGGDGGQINVSLSEAGLEGFLQLQANGGSGGAGGKGGSSGSGGGSQDCKNSNHSTGGGKSGRDGQSGQPGQPGRNGRADVRVVGSSSLRMIPRILETNPDVKLVAGGGAKKRR